MDSACQVQFEQRTLRPCAQAHLATETVTLRSGMQKQPDVARQNTSMAARNACLRVEYTGRSRRIVEGDTARMLWWSHCRALQGVQHVVGVRPRAVRCRGHECLRAAPHLLLTRESCVQIGHHRQRGLVRYSEQVLNSSE